MDPVDRVTQREAAVRKQFCASTNALKLLVGILGVSVMLAANAAVAAPKKQKPVAPILPVQSGRVFSQRAAAMKSSVILGLST